MVTIKAKVICSALSECSVIKYKLHAFRHKNSTQRSKIAIGVWLLFLSILKVKEFINPKFTVS